MRRLTFFLVLMCAVLFSIVRSDASSVVNIDKADLMFFIDTTGSMGDYIESVRSNLSSFARYLTDHGIDMSFAVIEFKDVMADGEDSTKINTFTDGSVWTSDISEVESVLASIDVDGGGDGPETPMEAITNFLVNYGWHPDAIQFVFLLTDADAKDITGSTDIPNTEALIFLLRRNKIYTSVVSQSTYEAHYHDLYTETGGKFIDINSSNYYELMLNIADWIVEYTDTDGDGLPDVWEREGIDIDGDGSMDVDLPAMGAEVNSPDIFVYYDWMYKAPDWRPFGIPFGEKNMKPDSAALELVVSQFRNHKIRLHLIEGQAIPYEDVFDLGGEWKTHWNNTAVEYFPRQYWTVARYCLFVNKYRDTDGETSSTGISELSGQFFIVSQGLLENIIQTAGTFMHELGHSLGLEHGGNDGTRFKPNYLSVMNYLYQLSGLIINSDEAWKKINYSDYELPALDEQNIDETRGLDPASDVSAEVSAKWILTKSLFGSLLVKTTVPFKPLRPLPSRSGTVGIAGEAVDFNDNGKIEGNTTADFYMESFDQAGNKLPHTSNELIPASTNDWKRIVFKGGLSED